MPPVKQAVKHHPANPAPIVPHSPGSAGQLGNQFLIQAVNHGPLPLTVKFDSVPYILHPEQPTFIPPACAWNWFGDPRSAQNIQTVKDAKGLVHYIGDRATEVRRLRVKYGAGIEGDETNFEGVPHVPDVSLFTVDGDPITTVIDDPTGQSVMPAVTTVAGDQALRDLVEQQQHQIEALMAHLELEQPNGQVTEATSEGSLPSDDDDLIPTI